MMKKKNRLLAWALTLALLLSACVGFAESEATSVPGSTDAPASQSAPTGTDAPTETDAPTGTDASAGTDAPTETDAPSETDAPTGTDAPTETDAPSETDVPTGTDAPTETDAPTGTDAPAQMNAPTGVEVPVDNGLNGTTAPVDNSTTLVDGSYTPENFSYSGGSGKTKISCTKVTVSGGKATATIVFSSDSWEYVKASGNQYNASVADGKASFDIPVDLNVNNAIIAKTNAMSKPKEVEYSICVTLNETSVEASATPAPTLEDGDYNIDIESDYKMFKVVSSSAKVQGGKVIVTVRTSSASYDRIYLGSKDDAERTNVITGTANGEGGYDFTFELPLSYMGQTVDFVPGKPDGSWYVKKAVHLNIPANLVKVEASATPEPSVSPEPSATDDVPVTDGDYNANVENNNKMFSVVKCVLKVKDGAYSATITLSGTGYDKLYIGNAEAAAAAGEESYIAFVPDADGLYTFTIPVSKLDETIAIAAHAVKSGEWKDKPLTFKSEGLEKVDAPVADGDYNANVENNNKMFNVVKCVLKVKNGAYSATITLSGTGYDKLYIGTAEAAAAAGEESYIAFVPDAEGLYTFTIPVSKLDETIAIAAHAVKSGEWKDKPLTFKSEGLEKVDAPVADGDYNANVENNNKMFNVVKCILKVKDGAYSATITLSGTGYDKLYIGTAEAAAAAGEESYIAFVPDAEGLYTFTIPVSKLDETIAIAAHAVKSGEWKDKPLTFKSEGLEAIGSTTQPTPEPEATPSPSPSATAAPELDGSTSKVNSSTALKDGVYTPDKFSWSGGSGRISISCNKVTVSGGKATATLVFSSKNIGYVKANGRKYYPSVGGGSSTVEIPVKLNSNNKIIGMTTAMSAAHEVTYTIYVYIQGADESASAAADAGAPALAGLTYESTEEMQQAKLVHIYRYQGGFTVIEVDGVGRYLTVPEGADIPVGLDEDATLIYLPVKSAYVAAENALRMIDGIAIPENQDAVKAIGIENAALKCMNAENLTYAGSDASPDYAALLKISCDFAIVSEIFATDEGEELPAELAEVQSRMELLGIPMFVDRSVDEESEEARLEWIKIYGILLGCEEQAQAYYQSLTA